MQKILLGLAASVAFTASAQANDTSWMQLDNEIAQLSSSVAAEDGVAVSGYMANFYNSDSDNNIGGWEFKSLRLNFAGKVDDMSFKVSTSLKSGTASLKDAYVKWALCDEVGITLGQFKRPFSWNFTTSSSRLLFYDNTMNGENETRDKGLMLSGSFGEEMFDWYAAVTNGDDLTGDKQHYTARLTADVAGKGAFNKHEGAIDGGEDFDASVGLAYAKDDSSTTGYDKVGVEGALTVNGLFFSFDMVDWNADAPGTVLDDDTGIDLDGTTPFSLTGSYLITDKVEVAARFEDFDDAANTERMTIGVNYYTILPHKMKWILNYQDLTSDTGAIEATVIRAGFVMSF